MNENYYILFWKIKLQWQIVIDNDRFFSSLSVKIKNNQKVLRNLWPEPYLCLSRKGSHIADLLRPQRVDDRAFSNIRVANETHTYLFLVCVELQEAKK